MCVFVHVSCVCLCDDMAANYHLYSVLLACMQQARSDTQHTHTQYTCTACVHAIAAHPLTHVHNTRTQHKHTCIQAPHAKSYQRVIAAAHFVTHTTHTQHTHTCIQALHTQCNQQGRLLCCSGSQESSLLKGWNSISDLKQCTHECMSNLMI